MHYTKRILREFDLQRDLYIDYGTAVNNLLESLLKKGKYKYQLSRRLKSRESLAEKIRRKRGAGKIYKRLSNIEDIMGIRIVFYTELDRKKFIKDFSKTIGGVLQISETSKVTGYRSTHATVTLNKDRTRLIEYKKFQGLKCEIQMTLILNHAWAEVEHDILYKEGSTIQGLDRKKYYLLKEKMEEIMYNHIEKASLGLEVVMRNTKKITKLKNRQILQPR